MENTVLAILYDYLEDNGFDGLISEDGKCQCYKDEWFIHCDSFPQCCNPIKRENEPEKE